MSAMELFNLYVIPSIPDAAPQFLQCARALLAYVEHYPNGTYQDAAMRLGANDTDFSVVKSFMLLKKFGFITVQKEEKKYRFDMTKMNTFHSDFAKNVHEYSEWAAKGDTRCFKDGCASWLKVATDAQGPFYDDKGEMYLKCKECDSCLQKASIENSHILVNLIKQV